MCSIVQLGFRVISGVSENDGAIFSFGERIPSIQFPHAGETCSIELVCAERVPDSPDQADIEVFGFRKRILFGTIFSFSLSSGVNGAFFRLIKRSEDTYALDALLPI